MRNQTFFSSVLTCTIVACGGSKAPEAEDPTKACPSQQQYEELVVEFFLKGLADQYGSRPQLTLEAEKTLRLMANRGHAKLESSAECERAIGGLEAIRQRAHLAIEDGNVVQASGPASLCPLWPLCE